jgi:hypothetical protein
MVLDQNLFTLNFTPNADDPAVLDLVDPAGVVHYRRQRESGPMYKMNVYGNAGRVAQYKVQVELMTWLRPDFGVPALLGVGAKCNEQEQDTRALQPIHGRRAQIRRHDYVQVGIQMGGVSPSVTLPGAAFTGAHGCAADTNSNGSVRSVISSANLTRQCSLR